LINNLSIFAGVILMLQRLGFTLPVLLRHFSTCIQGELFIVI